MPTLRDNINEFEQVTRQQGELIGLIFDEARAMVRSCRERFVAIKELAADALQGEDRIWRTRMDSVLQHAERQIEVIDLMGTEEKTGPDARMAVRCEPCGSMTHWSETGNRPDRCADCGAPLPLGRDLVERVCRCGKSNFFQPALKEVLCYSCGELVKAEEKTAVTEGPEYSEVAFESEPGEACAYCSHCGTMNHWFTDGPRPKECINIDCEAPLPEGNDLVKRDCRCGTTNFFTRALNAVLCYKCGERVEA